MRRLLLRWTAPPGIAEEFPDLDPVLITYEWRGGVEMLHRLDVRLLTRIIAAKQALAFPNAAPHIEASSPESTP